MFKSLENIISNVFLKATFYNIISTIWERKTSLCKPISDATQAPVNHLLICFDFCSWDKGNVLVHQLPGLSSLYKYWFFPLLFRSQMISFRLRTDFVIVLFPLTFLSLCQHPGTEGFVTVLHLFFLSWQQNFF